MEINLKTFLLAFALGVASPAFADQDLSKRDVVSSGLYWKRLLHYRNSSLTGERSEIDRPEFFLSPDGKKNARSELDASIDAFTTPSSAKIGDYDQHPQCAYPERFRYLNEALELKIQKVECPQFETWKKGLAAKSVVLVYAASYLGNPASLFGHTFLRLRTKGSDLLDAGVSFDALPTADRGLAYAWNGLTGGYRGKFSIQPYYSKIKTYSLIENRDLWEFELNLSSDEIERMIGHLWELGRAEFDYYFFDENCSYHLLSLLEIAKPDWNLRDAFFAKTVPLDTVRVVSQKPDAIRGTRVRPALANVLESRIGALSAADRDSFDKIRKDASQLRGDESAAALDALLDWQRFQTTNQAEGGSAFDSRTEERILAVRAAQSPKESPETRDESREFVPGASPQSGHRSSKASLSVAKYRESDRDGASSIGFELRPVLHDRLDSSEGYLASSNLIIARTAFEYFPREEKIALQSLTLAEVVNLRPITPIRSHVSWMVRAALERPLDSNRSDGLAGRFAFGIGASQLRFRNRLLVSVLAKLQPEISNAFGLTDGTSFRLSPSVEALGLLRLWNEAKIEIGAEQMWLVGKMDRDRPALLIGRMAIAIPILERAADLRMMSEVGWSERQRFETHRASLGYYF